MTSFPVPAADLLSLAAELVDVASPSHEEAELAGLIEARLREVDHLEVTRVGDNVVARTQFGRSWRLLLGGHTDTVPADDNALARVDGDRLHGLGAADMKGGLAVMLRLAAEVMDPGIDCTYVFYAREEVRAAESGLGELFELRPDLLVADAALLGEPTGGALEAGCQGTMRLKVTLRGERAHTARPWMGRNAVHRLAGILAALDTYSERRPVIDGCEFREALLAVSVEGGVAGNVVPDEVSLVVNHRFAPDRSVGEAERHVRDVLEPWVEPGDTVELVECVEGAAPSHTHPLIATLVARNDLEVRAKLGWTDVARFAAHGVPAANFGPGDATVAHTRGEFLDRGHLEAVWGATLDLILRGPDGE